MVEGFINFNIEEKTPTIIKVIGVGGGGVNAVEYMYEKGICDVDFVVCNTDKQDLEKSPVPAKIYLGDGLGAGNDWKRGEAAAQQGLDQIEPLLKKDTKMVFITAAMGGGTGTGAAPVIAKKAKEMGLLTIGIVTVPPRNEGPKRMDQAREGINRLKEHVDSLIVIDNERIKSIYGNQPLSAAFGKDLNKPLETTAKFKVRPNGMPFSPPTIENIEEGQLALSREEDGVVHHIFNQNITSFRTHPSA